MGVTWARASEAAKCHVLASDCSKRLKRVCSSWAIGFHFVHCFELRPVVCSPCSRLVPVHFNGLNVVHAFFVKLNSIYRFLLVSVRNHHLWKPKGTRVGQFFRSSITLRYQKCRVLIPSSPRDTRLFSSEVAAEWISYPCELFMSVLVGSDWETTCTHWSLQEPNRWHQNRASHRFASCFFGSGSEQKRISTTNQTGSAGRRRLSQSLMQREQSMN